MKRSCRPARHNNWAKTFEHLIVLALHMMIIFIWLPHYLKSQLLWPALVLAPLGWFYIWLQVSWADLNPRPFALVYASMIGMGFLGTGLGYEVFLIFICGAPLFGDVLLLRGSGPS